MDCIGCGQEMCVGDLGVDSDSGYPWFDFVCDGGPYAEEGVDGCGHKVRMRLAAPTALLLGANPPG